jgi:hypothetical protein
VAGAASPRADITDVEQVAAGERPLRSLTKTSTSILAPPHGSHDSRAEVNHERTCRRQQAALTNDEICP